MCAVLTASPGGTHRRTKAGNERLGDEVQGDPAAQAELSQALAHEGLALAQVRGDVERAIVSSQKPSEPCAAASTHQNAVQP